MESRYLSYNDAVATRDHLAEAILSFSSNFRPSNRKKILFSKYFAIDCFPIDKNNEINFGTFFIATSNNGISDAVLAGDMIHINVYDKLYKVNFSNRGCYIERVR